MRMVRHLMISIFRDTLEIIDSVPTILNHSSPIHQIKSENSLRTNADVRKAACKPRNQSSARKYMASSMPGPRLLS